MTVRSNWREKLDTEYIDLRKFFRSIGSISRKIDVLQSVTEQVHGVSGREASRGHGASSGPSRKPCPSCKKDTCR